MNVSTAAATARRHHQAPRVDEAERRREGLAELIDRHVNADGIHKTSVPRLCLIRYSTPSEPMPAVYGPMLCIVAQGCKQIMLAGEIYLYDPNRYLVVSVDLPVVGQVIEATPEAPYLCLGLDLDAGQLSELIVELRTAEARRQPHPALGRGLAVSPVDPQLLDAATRLVRLLDTPGDIPFLAPLIEREILYRLLSGDYSARLREMALSDNRMHSVSRAIDWLRRNYTAPFRIEAVAREAHMSPSALHRHFKTVTAMSPLQYQKQLRLQEARRLMLGESMDAATASLSVGYESPSQFSREYRRLFGAPPSRDIARLRETAEYAE